MANIPNSELAVTCLPSAIIVLEEIMEDESKSTKDRLAAIAKIIKISQKIHKETKFS